MHVPEIDELRYPVGRYHHTGEIGAAERASWIAQLRSLPNELQSLVSGLTEEQLNTPYRPEGWTVRQLVHHLPDSHMNSYVRFRLALTENAPTISSYEEAEWAQLPDARSGPIEPSLMILQGLHARWTMLLDSLDDGAFARTYRHPQLKEVRLDWALGLYDWHSRHHLAHIINLRRRMNW